MITHHSSLESFHEQLSYVSQNYVSHGLKAGQFKNVIIGGLGGSGIGGTITKGFFFADFPVPVEVVNDYSLPAYVDEGSLVVLGSYSGNTEETLSLLGQAEERNCTIIAVCAGGELMKRAGEKGYKVYTIETGYQPRMALGYSLGFLLRIFAELNDQDLGDEFTKAIDSLKNNSRLKEGAGGLLKRFQGSLDRRYTILTDAAFHGVAVRFAQQLNENSKQEAFVNVLPEANHNVIESYYGQLPSNFVILNSNSNERVGARFDFISGLLERENNKVAVLETEGISVTTLFEVIHLLDWYSIMITEPLEVDPMQIANIVSLKEFLLEV